MWRRGPQVEVNLHETAMIDFDARGGEISAAVLAIHPTATIASAASAFSRLSSLQKIIRTPSRRLLEGLDGSKAFVHNNSRLTKGCRNRSGHVLVFGRENPRAGLKKFDPGVKIGAKVAQKSTPVRGSLGNPG